MSRSRMEYLDGYSSRNGALGLLAFPEVYTGNTEFTMFYLLLDGKWSQKRFDFDISSFTFLRHPKQNYKAWWFVGKRGEVVEMASANPKIEMIETADTDSPNALGYLSKIRVIDDELFICGYRRQVYQRKGTEWELISRDILDNRAKGPWVGFEAIDGFNKNNVYAVGDKGEIWFFNGKKWNQCDSPTDQSLADVRCVGSMVWACGDGGIILCGNKDHWDIVWSGDKPSENWWNIEAFQGQIYIAGNNFLGRLENREVVEVKVGIKNKISTSTLHHQEGILWSIGERHILAFNGKTWQEFVVPENR